MPAKVELVSDAKHKRAGEVTALCFDGEHLYSGSEDGSVALWDKDLKFVRELFVHVTEGEKFPVLCMVVNEHKQIYTSARDGTLRFFRRPWSHDHNEIMLQTVMDDVTAIALSRNTNTLYSGDDKGIVTKWYHNQVGSQYNTMEEVKGLAIEGYNLYTVRESDVVITDIKPGMQEHTVRGTFPGRYPVVLAGPDVTDHEVFTAKHRQFVVAATRDGKGFSVATNDPPFKIVKTKENAHSMIINAMIVMGEFLITAGFDGKVKKWKNLGTEPTLVEEIDTGKCINCLCLGPTPTLYAGDSAGFIKRLRFSA